MGNPLLPVAFRYTNDVCTVSNGSVCASRFICEKESRATQSTFNGLFLALVRQSARFVVCRTCSIKVLFFLNFRHNSVVCQRSFTFFSGVLRLLAVRSVHLILMVYFHSDFPALSPAGCTHSTKQIVRSNSRDQHLLYGGYYNLRGQKGFSHSAEWIVVLPNKVLEDYECNIL